MAEESENENNDKYVPTKGQMPPHPSQASFHEVRNRKVAESGL